MSCIKNIFIVSGVLILITSFVLSVVIYPVGSCNNEKSEIAYVCEMYDDAVAIYSNFYKIVCNENNENEMCQYIKEEIDDYENIVKLYLDEYNVERCLDLWPD